MAFKSTLTAGLLVAVCVATGGCQNTAPRPASPTAFTQRPGSATPSMAAGNPQLTQPGVVNPSYTSAPGGLGGAPTATSTNMGNQVRSTQPYIPNSGGPNSAPDARMGVTTVGANPPTPPPPPANSNFGSPAFDPPIQPPVNPALGGPGLRN